MLNGTLNSARSFTDGDGHQ